MGSKIDCHYPTFMAKFYLKGIIGLINKMETPTQSVPETDGALRPTDKVSLIKCKREEKNMEAIPPCCVLQVLNMYRTSQAQTAIHFY